MASKTQKTSLMAHVAYRLAKKRELVATSALAHILDSSDAAKAALLEMLRAGGADVGAIEQVKDEVGDNQGFVDVVAFNKAREQRVLIEAKFWAGLTDNQPGSYLDRLPDDDKPAALLFLAPEKRLETLWPLLQRRARAGGWTLEVADPAGDLRNATIAGSNRHLMLSSWRTLLGAMESRAILAGDGPTGEDVRQLGGLCDLEDTEAFLPLRADELSPEMPRRLLDLGRLVDDATERACDEGFADKKGPRASGTKSYFGTYLRLGSEAKGMWAGAWFGVHYDWWRSDGDPLWVEFLVWNDTMPRDEINEKLGFRYRPLYLPIGKEYDEVLDSVVYGLRWCAQRLAGEIGDDEWAAYMKQ